MNTLPDARDTAKTRLPTGAAPLGHIHHGLWAHLWSDRSPDERLRCISDDAARRLRGLADVLRTLGLCPTTPKHDLDKFSFLAETTDDIANALDNGVTAVRASLDAEDPVPPSRKKRGKKRPGRRAG